MLNQGIQPFTKLPDWLIQCAVASGAGLLLGVAALRFSPFLVLGILLALLLFGAILKRHELAVLGIIVATSTIFGEASMPSLELGFGSLYMVDLLLLLLLGLIVLRWLVEPNFRIVRTPLDLPLLLFLGLAFLSTAVALLRSNVDFSSAVAESRHMAYYALFFAVTNLVRSKQQLMVLLRGLLLLAGLVAVGMFLQYMWGDTVKILPGRVEELYTEGRDYAGVTRILISGQSLVLLAFCLLLTSVILQPFRMTEVARVLLLVVTGLAVILTFNRSFWLSILLVLGLLFWIIREEERERFVLWGLLGVCLTVVVIMLSALTVDSALAKLVFASVERLDSLTETSTFESTTTSTLRWRDFEYTYSVPQAISHPVLGLGLGAAYRPLLLNIDYDADGTQWWGGSRYTHNGHLWLMMKTGLMGYGAFIWLLVAAIRRGLHHWRLVAALELRAAVLAFSLLYIAMVVINIVYPTFTSWTWIPLTAVMMGTNEVAFRLIERG